MQLTFAAPPGEEPWPVEVEGGFSTRKDAMLHGWFAGMTLRSFNLVGVAVGRLGTGVWEPLDSAEASKLACIRIPETCLYRPCVGDRVMDVRAGSWGGTGVVTLVSHGTGAPVVLVLPDGGGDGERVPFECPAADVVLLAHSKGVRPAGAGGPEQDGDRS